MEFGVNICNLITRFDVVQRNFVFFDFNMNKIEGNIDMLALLIEDNIPNQCNHRLIINIYLCSLILCINNMMWWTHDDPTLYFTLHVDKATIDCSFKYLVTVVSSMVENNIVFF